MNIVVCCKLTPDASDIEVKADGSISVERAEWIIGGFDLQAIEAGLRLAGSDGEDGGKLIALSAGPEKINNSKLRKDLLSRGPQELYLVVDPALKDANTAQTASVLAAAVRKIGDVDLVLFGEGSADLYFQQTGIQVGEMLGWPVVNAVSKIEVVDDAVRVERSLEDEIEVVQIPLPAALAVTTDIHQAHLPTMKDILSAARKPVTTWSLADLEEASTQESSGQIEILATRAPKKVTRKNILLEGSVEEMVDGLVEYLSKEGVLGK